MIRLLNVISLPIIGGKRRGSGRHIFVFDVDMTGIYMVFAYQENVPT